VITTVQTALLVPYIIIGVIGGGTTLNAISGGRVPYWFGGAIVALVVMGYVFFGGMRGTSYVNTFQTILFMLFGTLAVVIIGSSMGGFRNAMTAMQASSATSALLTRERISPLYFFSYTFIPLSAIAFPHMTIFCLTARKMAQFKKTVIFYPICILLVWLPSVFLGVMANRVTDSPEIRHKIEARRTLATQGRQMSPEQRDELRDESNGDDVVLILLNRYAPLWLAGILGAGIMAAVMASDSQILALSTMFTEDIFAYYGGRRRFGERAQVQTGRLFIVVITIIAYVIALRAPETIFDLAIQYAFSGFAALSPLLVAALFWRRSTKWGALAATLWTALAVIWVAIFQSYVPAPAPGQATVCATLFGFDAVTRTPGGTAIFGFMPVVPMVVVSVLLMIVISLVTKQPQAATLARYFSRGRMALHADEERAARAA
jgi:SSS family solute:Na+ symporter